MGLPLLVLVRARGLRPPSAAAPVLRQSGPVQHMASSKIITPRDAVQIPKIRAPLHIRTGLFGYTFSGCTYSGTRTYLAFLEASQQGE